MVEQAGQSRATGNLHLNLQTGKQSILGGSGVFEPSKPAAPSDRPHQRMLHILNLPKSLSLWEEERAFSSQISTIASYKKQITLHTYNTMAQNMNLIPKRMSKDPTTMRFLSSHFIKMWRIGLLVHLA